MGGNRRTFFGGIEVRGAMSVCSTYFVALVYFCM